MSVVPNAWSGGLLSGRLAAVLGSGLVVLLILAVIGYVVLPQATVVVTPVAAPIGPITFAVRADPDATSIDATGGVIPATRLSLDFTASGEFPATGKRVVQTKAKGAVTFRNCDTSAGHTIPGGSVVSTAAGIGFATGKSDPRRHGADHRAGSRHVPTAVSVIAFTAGTGGNVAAAPSTRSRPASTANRLRDQPARRRWHSRGVHPGPAGGHRRRSGRPHEGLGAQFAAWAAAPPGFPAGTTAYPATGKLSTRRPVGRSGSLINVEEATFQLGASATGTVVAVDTSQIDRSPRSGCRSTSPPTTRSRTARSGTHDNGQADGELIDFRVDRERRRHRGPRPGRAARIDQGQAGRRGARDPRPLRDGHDRHLAGLRVVDPEPRLPARPDGERRGRGRQPVTGAVGQRTVSRILGLDLGSAGSGSRSPTTTVPRCR